MGALTDAGVPHARHLMYHHTKHSDFVLFWRPHGAGSAGPQERMPGFASDTLALLRALGGGAVPLQRHGEERTASIMRDATAVREAVVAQAAGREGVRMRGIGPASSAVRARVLTQKAGPVGLQAARPSCPLSQRFIR